MLTGAVQDLMQLSNLGIFVAAAVLVLTACLVALELRSRRRHFEGQLFLVSVPTGRGAPEQFFSTLHGLLRSPFHRMVKGQPWVSLELVGCARQVRFQMWIARGDEALVKAMLRAAYPGVELGPVSEMTAGPAAGALARAGLACGDFLPIRTSFEGEPLSSLVATLAAVDAGELRVQLLVRPKSSRWQHAARRQAESLRDKRRRGALLGGARTRPAQIDRDRAKAIEEKAGSLGFDCLLRVVAAGQREAATGLLRASAASLRAFAGANSIVLGSISFTHRVAELHRWRRFPVFGSFILTAPELAGLWHLPSEALNGVDVVRSPKLAAPAGASAGTRLLGVSSWGDEQVPVRLSIGDSRHHLHLLGSSGTGKTTAMLNLAAQDIAAGRGVAVLDPKGDLVRQLLPRIPRERLDEVVLISPHESDLSVGINPLELWPGDDRDLVAENTLTIFKRIYERYWGPRTDDVLKSALLTLLRRPDSTLAHVPLLLTDPAFRRRTLEDVSDPLGLDGFWTWFEHLSEAQRGEAIGPVLNKLRDFLVRPRLRRLLCQPRSTVDLRQVVDSGQILLADLSVGRWGDTTAALIGSFLVARLWQAVLARAATEEERRRDFFLFVDEFQHFVGVSGPFADVLAEARSLRLSLTIANQHLGQLSRDLREAIASNARSRLVFQCGQDDAAYLAREFAPFDATALMSLARFEAAARLSIEGRSSRPFTLRALPPSGIADPTVGTEAMASAMQRFGRPVAVIDRELHAAVGPGEQPQGIEARRRRR